MRDEHSSGYETEDIDLSFDADPLDATSAGVQADILQPTEVALDWRSAFS